MCWYALSTRPRHEKRVAAQLARSHIEACVPLREVLSQWKDRRTLVQLPLFPGSVFVRMGLMQKGEVLRTRGVVGVVSVNGVPAAIPDEQMAALRQVGLARRPCASVSERAQGRWVRVREGPLAGVTGRLIETKGEYRLLLSLDLLQQAVAVKVDPDSVVAFDG